MMEHPDYDSTSHGEREFLVLIAPEEPVSLVNAPSIKRETYMMLIIQKEAHNSI